MASRLRPPTRSPTRTTSWRQPQTSNVETSNVETSNVETSNVETSNVENAKPEIAKSGNVNSETASFLTSNVDAANVEASNAEAENVEAANVEAAKFVAENSGDSAMSAPIVRTLLAPFEFEPLRIAPPADAVSLVASQPLESQPLASQSIGASTSEDVSAKAPTPDFAPFSPFAQATSPQNSPAPRAFSSTSPAQFPASQNMNVPAPVFETKMARLSGLHTLLLGGLLACALVGLGAFVGGRRDVSSTQSSGASVDLANQNAIISAVQQVGPAVMNVDTTFGGNGDKNFLPQPGTSSRPVQGKGTGFVFDSARGLMLTNAHVVADAQKIQVTTRDGKKYTGRILGVDRRSDIAVVALSSKSLPAAKLAPMKNAKDLQIGQWAIAIGNPFAQANTVTVGVVSAVGRTIPETNEKTGETFQLTDMIQTDAAINPGNSGGPLCNIKGEVIGINTAIYGIGTGLGFTIPINKAKAVADEIIKHGSVRRAFVGLQLQPISSATQQEYGLKDAKGALIQGTVPDSPAARAGFLPGDIIRRINGQPMTDKKQVDALLEKQKIGDKIKIEIARNGANRVLELKSVEQKGA